MIRILTSDGATDDDIAPTESLPEHEKAPGPDSGAEVSLESPPQKPQEKQKPKPKKNKKK